MPLPPDQAHGVRCMGARVGWQAGKEGEVSWASPWGPGEIVKIIRFYC
jgi:hypothetical protein